MESAGAFLMGRKLYDEWSEYWTHQGPEVPFSEFINTVPKYVLSTTLTDPTWQNTTILSGDVVAEVQAAKDSTEGDIQISGSATTVRWLLANNLLDKPTCWCTRSPSGRGSGCSRTRRPTPCSSCPAPRLAPGCCTCATHQPLAL